jgi:uncharacterized protein (TIGR03086 family)
MISGAPIRRESESDAERSAVMAIDLEPTTRRLCAIVEHIPDGALDDPTPCGVPVAALLDHLAMFAVVFTEAANKDARRTAPRAPDATQLASDWRTAIPRGLTGLAHAWNKPAAWEGMTTVRGMDFPGEVAGTIALDEVVMHGWDLARATGQPYDADPGVLDALTGFLTHLAEPGMGSARDGIFGPVVDVDDDAPQFDRLLGLGGRDPNWTPPR